MTNERAEDRGLDTLLMHFAHKGWVSSVDRGGGEARLKHNDAQLGGRHKKTLKGLVSLFTVSF